MMAFTTNIMRFRAGHPEMEMVQVSSEAELAALPMNRWGIRQHADDAPSVRSVFDAGRLDVVLMPGQAFTADGRRLGRGKGYYDRFLARCRSELRPPPATLALAFRQQLLPDLPTTRRDARVDAVLYEPLLS
ncbi:5-formyltetrahydrofolate cyclo-ligase [Gryllus bimaculatus]|nr:5-formyltetrahydrofolate cyclo-ligase [Gryllus bimaculatus]